MLTHSQTKFLLLASYSKNNPFFNMPKEIIRHIKYLPSSDNDFLDALKEVVNGKLNELKNRLNQAESDLVKLKSLLLQADDVITPCGLQVKGVTLLECAIGSGDPEIVALIKPYFLKFKDGEYEREIQLKRYHHCINEIEIQKANDLTELINIIKISSEQDVQVELLTGNRYVWGHKSLLRDALDQFRKDKLNPKQRIIDKPRIHCNYHNLIHAYEVLSEALKDRASYSYKKYLLIWQQIIGFIQLVELPIYERYVFSQGQINDVIIGKEINRRLIFQFDIKPFPDMDMKLINAHSNFGFDSYVSIYGILAGNGGGNAGSYESIWVDGLPEYKEYIKQKFLSLQNLCSTLKNHPHI